MSTRSTLLQTVAINGTMLSLLGNDTFVRGAGAFCYAGSLAVLAWDMWDERQARKRAVDRFREATRSGEATWLP